MAETYPWLEEIWLKRMVVSDEALELISKSFKNFKVLVLASCEGINTDGLAANCRNLKELDLREFEVEDLSGHWLSHFPDNCTSLVSLNIACLGSEVLDYIEDTGLQALSAFCKDLQELRVFPSVPLDVEPNVSLTEQGLVAVSEGCPKLQLVHFFCHQMTNGALVAIARNRPNMIRFDLCIIEPLAADYVTLKPLDIGFGAIVKHCTVLRWLSLSSLLIDRVFEYIRNHAKKLEILSIAFAGDSDLGLHHVLSGCESLQKLEIRDCPFIDEALLANAAKLETMQSLWMPSCSVIFEACKLLGQKMRRLNVELIDERGPLDSGPENIPVEKLYIYWFVAGSRFDMPSFVLTMEDDATICIP